MISIAFAAGTEIEFQGRRYTLAEDTEPGKYDSTCSDAKARPGKAKRTVAVRFFGDEGILKARIGSNTSTATVVSRP